MVAMVLRHVGCLDFINLIYMVDTRLVCPGVCDSELLKLVTIGNHHGSFKDRQGSVKAQLMIMVIKSNQSTVLATN